MATPFGLEIGVRRAACGATASWFDVGITGGLLWTNRKGGGGLGVGGGIEGTWGRRFGDTPWRWGARAAVEAITVDGSPPQAFGEIGVRLRHPPWVLATDVTATPATAGVVGVQIGVGLEAPPRVQPS